MDIDWNHAFPTYDLPFDPLLVSLPYLILYQASNNSQAVFDAEEPSVLVDLSRNQVLPNSKLNLLRLKTIQLQNKPALFKFLLTNNLPTSKLQPLKLNLLMLPQPKPRRMFKLFLHEGGELPKNTR